MPVAKIREGRTDLFVPKESLGTNEPPTSPVFFNPAAETNRDVSVAIVQASGGRDFCDALAGIGARGVRVANEVSRGVAATLVDFNAPAMRLARRNARLNGLACSFAPEESKSFLVSRFRRESMFDYVDVDPFGTPIQFIQAAVGATRDGGLLSLTATDTAVLCGVYPQVARRRYWASPLNNSFAHETGIRILLDAARRVAASSDVAVFPVAAHSTRHYIRVFARVELGATKADQAMKSEGYVVSCSSCRRTVAAKRPSESCEDCGAKARLAGPLWAGPLVDERLVGSAAKVCKERGFSEAEGILLGLASVDDFPPFGFSLDEVCSALKVPTVAQSKVEEELAKAGFKSGPQPFEREGIKTDAGWKELAEAVTAARASSA